VNLKDRSGGIEIQVKDNGVGIPVEHIDMIFDKFRQVDKSLRRGQEGSGLGLAIVKSIIDIHHGTVSVESGMGKGSTMSIFLPDTPEPSCSVDNSEVAATRSEDSIRQDQMEMVMLEFSDIYL
ncbi:MAG: ATP-binding protein, partial [Bacillota bacterium]|nr:ATP-binding protein [Bacillota bacterium]